MDQPSVGMLSDNGSRYIASDLAEWLEDQGMTHIRGAPRHPSPRAVRGTVAPVGSRKPPNERWHQTLKNRILLEYYYLPGALEEQVSAFVEHYNHSRAHESLSNLTPADVYLGRGEAILAERERIKNRPSPTGACSTTPQPPNLTPRWTRPSDPEPHRLSQIT